MNRIIWWVIFLIIITNNLNINAQEVKFGILSGLDVANAQLTNKQSVYGDYRTYYPMISFNANAYISYKSIGIMGVSFEPGFIQKGGVMRDNNSYDIRVQCNYIQLPFLFNLYLNNKVYFSIGPELAYLLNAKAKSKLSSNDITDLYEDNKFELSATIGVNYNVFGNFDVGLRYNHGITSVLEIFYTDENGNPLGKMNQYNQYFQLIVRFKI